MHCNLVDLVQQDRLDELDQAWTAQLAEPGDVSSCCQALALLCERDMASRALPMASALLGVLVEKDRLSDATDVGMTLVRLDAHNDSLGQQLFGTIEKRFGPESWYPLIRDLAGLGHKVTTEALESFEKMRRYTVGHVIYHRAGWGEGVVEHFDPQSRELSIRFSNDRTTHVPLTTALESMQPLPDDDLRSMLLIAKDKLAQQAEEDPVVLIRKAAQIYRGRVTSTDLKSMLCPAVVSTKNWTGFWKRAKAAAAVDPYLQVEGNPTRPVFVLRKKPLSFADEIQRTIKHADHLGHEIAQIREYLERSHEKTTQDTILGIAQQRIEAAAREGKASHSHILDGILLLEQHGRHPSASAATELRAMLSGDGEDFKPEAFEQLTTQDSREHAVQLLPEAFGDAWVDLCVSKLTRIPGSVVEAVVTLLHERGHAKRLAPAWDQIAPYPQRHPTHTYVLGRLAADGALDGTPGAPDRTATTRVLLHLARVLASRRKGDPVLARLQTRVVSLLTGRRSFLAQVVNEVDREVLASFLGICERGGEDFPQEISDTILRGVADRFPELTKKLERPFWELDAIYVTRSGLLAKRAEYRRLVDELIPKNSEQIKVAASHGDLSENSEWEAAMEEQRNLTTRAAMMDEDLRKAKLIEDAEIPAGVVAPGTAVTFASGNGERRRVQVLGPWDAASDDTINYLAPFMRPLLGKVVGDVAILTMDGREHEVKVELIERIV